MTWGVCETAETFVLKLYLENMISMSRQPRTIDPRAIPSITTKMSLLGDWTKTPGRRPAEATVDDRPDGDAALEPRLDGRRDNVTLLYLLALVSIADHLQDGLVRFNRDDPGCSDIFRAQAGAEDVQLMARRPARRPSRSMTSSTRLVGSIRLTSPTTGAGSLDP